MENYTDQFVEVIHAAIKEEAVEHKVSKAMVATSGFRGEHHEAYEELDSIPWPKGHRQKIGNPSMWCALVTKTLHPGDPLCRHPNAVQCVQDELSDLRKAPTWDENSPMEAVEMFKKYPDAHIARIFPIIGIKHWEDPENHRWKGRIVLCGKNIKTITGEWALFNEMGAVPSLMTAVRAIIAAYALFHNTVLLQSDCVRAYIQADMKGPPTFIRMPKAWWPKGWEARFKDPVCRLLRALYGHPHAGNFWADKLGSELKKLGFSTIEGWSAVYTIKMEDGFVAIFVVYVDDLVMYGSPKVHEVIQRIRKTIDMEDPGDLQKYLGCIHHVMRKASGG